MAQIKEFNNTIIPNAESTQEKKQCKEEDTKSQSGSHLVQLAPDSAS